MQPIVDAPRHCGRDFCGKLLRRRRAVREHLNVDCGFVHLFEPQRAEIFQPRILLAWPPGLAAGIGFLQFVVPVMLFERDDGTMRFLEHCDSPSLVPAR